jgi:2-polyprenyl-3-methyl-5-hydroxy-6-metoxy-1,4-benzoquinol methylase
VAAYRFRSAIATGTVGDERASAPADIPVAGILTGGSATAVGDGGYPFKWHPSSSHGRLLARAGGGTPMRVLDLGCAAGFLAEQLRLRGHYVTGVDHQHCDGVTDRTDEFIQADLGDGLPDGLRGPFDLVVAGDVLEHLRHPEVLLTQIHSVIAPNGSLLVSVPNFSHWYPRARVASGAFGYDKRGILDEDHVRFFTRKTITRLFASTEWHIVRREPVGVPWEEILRHNSKADNALRVVEKVALLARETLFAYQFLFELVEASTGANMPPGNHEPTTAS